MRKLLLIALLPLAGCVTAPQSRGPSPQEITANDPSTACMREASRDARLAVLLPKIGSLQNAGQAPISMMTSKELPTRDEKEALEVWGGSRQTCLQTGASYRAKNMPVPVAMAMEAGQERLILLTARLWAGDINYGQFNQERISIRDGVRSNYAAFDKGQAQARAQDEERRDAASRDFQDAMYRQQLILQQQQMQNQQIYQQNRPVSTDCRRFGNQVNCTTY